MKETIFLRAVSGFGVLARYEYGVQAGTGRKGLSRIYEDTMIEFTTKLA